MRIFGAKKRDAELTQVQVDEFERRKLLILHGEQSRKIGGQVRASENLRVRATLLITGSGLGFVIQSQSLSRSWLLVAFVVGLSAILVGVYLLRPQMKDEMNFSTFRDHAVYALEPENQFLLRVMDAREEHFVSEQASLQKDRLWLRVGLALMVLSYLPVLIEVLKCE